ncbi:MAG: hypothetical protein ACXWW2_09210 [Candidatus Deferrimicrobiaceae bacterium]
MRVLRASSFAILLKFGSIYCSTCVSSLEDIQAAVKELAAFSFYGEKRVATGKLAVKISVAEYPRESGLSFDEFFARIEEG